MEQIHFSERYKRQIQLPGFGEVAQQKLKAAKVLVVGAGGLGVPALQYLAGMGVGIIGIVDDDVISLSNLHRQVLYTTEETGQPKALVAAAKLAKLNPDVALQPCHTKLTPGNALDIIRDYDLVLDATDNFSARYLINDACVILNKPFVYGAVHQYEGQVSVFNLGNGPTYRCLYPNPPAAAEIPDCNAAGILGVAPGLIGCWQALEAVKIIASIGKHLSGYLQVFDFLNDEQYRIKLKVNLACKQIAALQESYETPLCVTSAGMLYPDGLKEWFSSGRSFMLLDVRERDEFESGHLPRATNIPLAALHHNLSAMDSAIPVIVYCQKGNRSAKAVQILQQLQPALQLFDLAGGMENWLEKEAYL